MKIAKIIPSKAFKYCHDCDKEFGCFLYRYRCDKCQFCYCNQHLKRITKDQGKKIRLCELCLENSKKNKLPEAGKYESDSAHDESSEILSVADALSRSEDLATEKFSKVKNLLSEIQSQQFNFFMRHIDRFSLKVCVNKCLSQGLSKDWGESLMKTVEDVCKTVCPSVAVSQDQMDINKYIKFVKIVGTESCEFFKAALLTKQCAYKRIKKEINDCRVIIIKGTTWFYLDHKKIVSITDIINQEKQYIISLLKTLSDLKPNIILLEKNMPQKLIKKLEILGIGVQMNVNLKKLQKISRITNAKILRTLFDLEDLEESIGTCKKYEEIKIGNKVLSAFHDTQSSLYTGSVVLRSGTYEDIKKCTGILREMNILYRNFLLERNVLWQMGVSSKKNIFKILFGSNLTCNFVSTGLNAICKNPVSLNIDFYSSNDMTLGEHLISAFLSFDKECDVCLKLEIGKHNFYYISDRGRVKFCVEKEPDKTNYEIGLYKECMLCRNIGNFSYISQSISEYSFHKFIYNFFHDNYINHTNLTCTHEGLKSCRYVFVSQGLRASFEYQENNKYTLLPVSTNICTHSLKSILLQNFYSIKDSIKKLISALVSAVEVAKIDTEDKSPLLHDLWSLHKELDQLEILSQDSIFSLEAYRKYYYSKITLTKLKLEGLLHKKTKDIPLKVLNSDYLSLSLIEFPIKDEDSFFHKAEYLSLLSGQINLFTNLCQKSIPLYENDPFSILAYTFASIEYSEEIQKQVRSFNEIEEILEYELYNPEVDKFKFSQTNFNKEELENHSFQSEISQVFGSFYSFTVTLFFPKHFQCLISAIFPNFSNFIESISKSSSKIACKNLYFSSDSKFILKLISHDKFKRFKSFAPSYFRHSIKSIFHKMPSALIRSFALVKLSYSVPKSKPSYFILQESLSGLTSPLYKSYKLRPQKREKKNSPSLNSQFFEDFSGLPILLHSDQKKIQDAGIWNDTLFLSKQGIMNYSLAVKVNQEDLSVAAGIYDYFDQLTFEKAIENKYKLSLGNDSINPDTYKEIFRSEMMQTYFTSQ